MIAHQERGGTAADGAVARMQAIARCDSASRDELAMVLEWLGSERTTVQRCAAETLADLGRRQSAVHELLLERLGHGSVRAQWGACYALALMERLPAAALPVLLRALGCHDGDVRWAAAHLLVRLKEEPGVTDAVWALAGAGDAGQRKMAVYCVRDFGFATPETESVLIACLKDEHPAVRLAAVSAVSHVACDRLRVARKLIALTFEDADRGVRRAAAVALGQLGDDSPEVIAALQRAAHESDSSLRRAAARSLRLLTA